MTFVVEDGTGRPDATSGVSVDYADEYLAATGYAPDWATKTLPTKRGLLMSATGIISNSFNFRGTLAFETQGLPFPRIDLRDRENRLIIGVPLLYKNAVCEVAYAISQNNFLEDNELGALESIKVGPISLEVSAMASESKVIPDFTLRMLGEYGSYRFTRARMRQLISG